MQVILSTLQTIHWTLNFLCHVDPVSDTIIQCWIKEEKEVLLHYFSQLTVNHGLEKSLFSNSSGILHAKVVELLNMMYYVFNSSL